jgi:hypothetical protein
MAGRKAEIEPDGMADDLSRESMMFVRIGGGWVIMVALCLDTTAWEEGPPLLEELFVWHEYAMMG